MKKIIFSQKHIEVLEKFKDLTKSQIPELFDEILFVNAPGELNNIKELIEHAQSVYVGSIFSTQGNFCDEYSRTTFRIKNPDNLLRIMFTTTSPEYEMDQIKKYGFNKSYSHEKPVKNLIVIPKSNENFIFMVKTIIEKWTIDKGLEVLKQKFTYVEM